MGDHQHPQPGRGQDLGQGHGQGHGHGHGASAVRASPAARLVLACLVAPLAVAVIAGVGLLWPRGPAPASPGVSDSYQGVTFVNARIVTVQKGACRGDASDRQADGSIPATVTCVHAIARLLGGPRRGATVSTLIPALVARSGIHPGEEIQLAHYPATADLPETYGFLDFSREVPLGILAAGFALLVVAVARLRGLLALAGLALAYGMIAFFILPALRHGENPFLVAALGASAIMIAILYLAHGVSAKTTTALLGTLFGVWLSAGLAAWASSAAHLNGLGSEENQNLSRLIAGTDLSGIVLCGIILAGLGVLNDVTITQASAVWELHASGLAPKRLFASGMQIGRDHLASTVYTIAFAYAGAALPSLLLIDISGTPLHQVITGSQVAEEIVRTLVGSIGLVLAIPLTTAIAVVVVRAGTEPTRGRAAVARHAAGHDPSALP